VPGYEKRDGQMAYARAVEACIDPEKNPEGTPILVEGPTGCHRKGTPILLWDGSVKPVEHVTIGDRLMGPDSLPRTVLELRHGLDAMWEVRPKKGGSFFVNTDHVLTLQRTETRAAAQWRRKDYLGGSLVDVTVREYLTWPKSKRHLYKLVRTGVDFGPNLAFAECRIEGYDLGVILGDGTTRGGGSVGITTTDPEIEEAVRRLASRYFLRVRKSGITFFVVGAARGGSAPNQLIRELKRLGLYGLRSGEKFVPDAYKVAAREIRLAVLAGLIDTDGSLTCGCYDFVSKSRRLADDVTFLARSVGLAAYVNPCRKGCQTGAVGTYYRVSISGDTAIIPVRIERKKAARRMQKKSVLRTGFEIKKANELEFYYGFSLDGDGRFLLGDFTITHNTGKTLGYLIPTIGSILTRRFRANADPSAPAWKSRRRVLVVTANIALQEQLVEKDLPTIRRITGWDFTFALLKGRSNFACHASVEETKGQEQKKLFDDDLDVEVKRLQQWFERTKTGDKSEVDPSPKGLAWSMVTSTSDGCANKKCPWYAPCYYYGQRRAAWSSDVIVTNYAMLLTEIQMRQETGRTACLMPEFDIVVCDEAHDLGDIARKFFAVEFKATRFAQMGRLLGGPRLQLKEEAQKAWGLARLVNDTAQHQLQTAAKGSVLYDPLRFAAERGTIVSELKEIASSVRLKVTEFARTQGYGGMSLADLPEGVRKTIEAMQRPAVMAENALEEIDGVFPEQEAAEKTVYYIESGFGGDDEKGRKNYSFVACPFSAGEALKDALWDQCESVILTSATLATRLKADSGSRFGFVRSDLGLASATCYEEIVDSPFDFQKNMGVYIDASINPQDEDREAVVRRVTALLRASHGRALVLFTSYKAMNEVHAGVSGRVPYRCYKQGESPRNVLTTRFRDEVSSCLFATRSFFQGIDVQGESLSLLILDRLPFPMMNDPFIETAKAEGERSGRKWAWFDQHSIPRAMMAFRQATGRLIRTRTDRGVVAILDSRIAATGGKAYGKLFRETLPSTQYLATTDDVADFFGTEARDLPVEEPLPLPRDPKYDDEIPF
jgi:Rad3-related DNA helicase